MSSTYKQTIQEQDWQNDLDKVKVSKKQMNEIIMNFLIIEGYREPAIAFSEESGIECILIQKVNKEDINCIEERIEVRNLIHQESIQKAIDRINQLNPLIFTENEDLLFKLKLQHLIDLIKKQAIQDSLLYAEQQLLPFGLKNEEQLQKLEQVMSLLAFKDLSHCPLQDLITNSQKIKLSSEVNYILLSYRGKQKSNCIELDSKMLIVLQYLKWMQKKLKEHITFPMLIKVICGSFQFDDNQNNN